MARSRERLDRLDLLGYQSDERDLARTVEPQGKARHAKAPIHVHRRAASQEHAPGLIRDHARSVVVGGKGKGDLSAVGVSREYQRKTELLRVSKEARSMSQQYTRDIARDLGGETFERGTFGVFFHPAVQRIFEPGDHQRCTLDLDAIPFIAQQPDRCPVRESRGNRLGPGIVIVVPEYCEYTVSRLESGQLTASLFDVLRIEVENITGDEDQIGIQPIDPGNEACETVRSQQRADVQVGDVL